MSSDSKKGNTAFSAHHSKYMRDSHNFKKVAQYGSAGPPFKLSLAYDAQEERFVFSIEGPKGRSWIAKRTQKDLNTFRENLFLGLDTQHTCKGCCPYLYFISNDLFSRMPRHPAIRRRVFKMMMTFNQRRLLSNIGVFNQNIYDLIASPGFQKCDVNREKLANTLIDFVCNDLTDNDRSTFTACLFASATDSNGRGSARGPTSAHGRRSQDSPNVGPAGRSPSSKCIICQRQLDMSTTTLPCGHQFHDECILEHLEIADTLACPHCQSPLQ